MAGSLFLRLENVIGKNQKIVPVGLQNVVLAGVTIEAQIMQQQMIERRKIGFRNSGATEQFINGRGGLSGQKFAVGIAPPVIAAGIQEQWPWRDQRNQHV